MNKDITLLTSESVTEGHPDKVCDMISDALLDAYLEEDPSAHVALETMASEDTVFIAGEVASFAKVDVKNKAREVICEIGYDSKEKGIDGKECLIITNIGVQSPDIAQGVTQCNGTIGAGDQGMMYGYACDDTEELMPLSISLAHKLSKRLTQVRKEGILPYLYPDGKSQVTVAYNNQGEILGVTDVVISAQHNAEVSVQKLRMDIEEHVIREVIPKELLLPDVKIHINPTGRFVVGGPAGDVLHRRRVPHLRSGQGPRRSPQPVAGGAQGPRGLRRTGCRPRRGGPDGPARKGVPQGVHLRRRGLLFLQAAGLRETAPPERRDERQQGHRRRRLHAALPRFRNTVGTRTVSRTINC